LAVPVLGNENENVVYLSQADVHRNSNAVYRRNDGQSLREFFARRCVKDIVHQTSNHRLGTVMSW